MNKTQQRSEIKQIFEADVNKDEGKIVTTHNKTLEAVSVTIHFTCTRDIIISRTIELLITKGYSKFSVARRDYGLRFNVFYKH